jgi:hypothetical protein
MNSLAVASTHYHCAVYEIALDGLYLVGVTIAPDQLGHLYVISISFCG